MNNYFTRVINMILAFDGDVVKFAGDSMIVVFTPSPSEARDEDGGIKAAVTRCAQCAHVLANKLGHMRMKMNGQIEPIAVHALEAQRASDAAAVEAAAAAAIAAGAAAGDGEHSGALSGALDAELTGRARMLQVSAGSLCCSLARQILPHHPGR